MLALVVGGVIGYKLHKCQDKICDGGNAVTIIKETSPDGTVKETKVVESKPIPPPPIPRYTVGITTDFNSLGALFTYRPFEKIPISIGGYVIPQRSFGVAITFNF